MGQRLAPSTAIHRLAEFTHSLALDAVSSNVRRQAALSLIDTGAAARLRRLDAKRHANALAIAAALAGWCPAATSA